MPVKGSPLSKDIPGVTYNQMFSFEDVNESVSPVKAEVETAVDNSFKQAVVTIQETG